MANQFVYSLLLLIAATSTYAQLTSPVGIIGGVPATSSARTYAVSLQNLGGKIICEGALYNDITVITAASCLLFLSPEIVLVGVNNGAKKIKIVKFVPNPDFGVYTNEHDVALLKLAEPVSAEYVELPSKQPATGSTGLLTGWDANKSLVDVPESIISLDDCASGSYGFKEDVFLASTFCGLAENGACNAIGGTPLVSNGQLVGLLYSGSRCGRDPAPTLFTNIYAEKAWIESSAKNL